ncbi:MAG TPA: NAD(P)-binding protein, partial [Burkholderiales bacterium]
MLDLLKEKKIKPLIAERSRARRVIAGKRRVTKTVIIGAGLSGLAAGCLLSGHGVDVTICEANDKAGGCCATTASGGYTFHDGAVYVAAA